LPRPRVWTVVTQIEPSSDDARDLLDKLKAFSATLEPPQRALLAALLAPGVALAYEGDEVVGFGMVDWIPDHLPRALERAVRERNLHISGW